MAKGNRFTFCSTHMGDTSARQRIAAVNDGMNTMLSNNDTTAMLKYAGYIHLPLYTVATKINGWSNKWK